jgi:hypothetical protein
MKKYEAHASPASAEPNTALAELATWVTGIAGKDGAVVGEIGLQQDTNKNYIAWAMVVKPA